MLHLIQYIPSQKLMLSLCFNFANIDEVEFGNGAYHKSEQDEIYCISTKIISSTRIILIRKAHLELLSQVIS